MCNMHKENARKYKKSRKNIKKWTGRKIYFIIKYKGYKCNPNKQEV